MRALAILLPLSLLGCMSQEPGAPAPVDHVQADAQPRTQLVFSRLQVPQVAAQTDSPFFGFDLDNDSRHVLDNKLGAVVNLIESNDPGWQLQAVVDAQVGSGASILLAERRGSDASEDAVVRIFPGRDADADATNNLGGAGRFTVDPGVPPEVPLYGHQQAGSFASSELGDLFLDLALTKDGPPIRLHLIGARITLEPDPAHPGAFLGKLGGGISRTDMHDVVMPVIAVRWKAALDAAAPGSPLASERQVMDTDRDGRVTIPEIVDSSFATTVLSPDVDLVDDSQLPALVYQPDGKKDSVSVGIAFEAVPATF